MRRLRVSILAGMGVVVTLAIAFAGLRSGSVLAYSAFYTMTVALLLVAVLAARYRRGRERAFWFGFAVFGWAFLLLGSGPLSSTIGAMSEGSRINYSLLTSRVVLFLVPRLRPETEDLEDIGQITANTIGIANLLVTQVLALVGGAIAAWMRSRGRRASSSSSRAIIAPLVYFTGQAALAACVISGDHPRRPASYFPVSPTGGDTAATEKPRAHRGSPVATPFPGPVTRSPDGISPFENEWYSEHLAAMGEPLIWGPSLRDREATRYRLLWLPTFHHPVCVRIEKSRGGARLRAVVLDGRGGYEPGQVAIERDLTLGDDRWADLQRQLEMSAYWAMPTKAKGDEGLDGNQLIVEGVKEGRYHVVDRGDPDPAYRELCRFMLGLTGIKTDGIWKKYNATD